MSCNVCQSNPPSVCVRCLTQNITKFRQKVSTYDESNKRYVETVNRQVASLLPSTKEIDNQIRNIQRETEYTHNLLLQGEFNSLYAPETVL